MRALVDANFLIYLIDKRNSEDELDQVRMAKLQGVLELVSSSGGGLVIPTPALSEYLINAKEAGELILAKLLANKFVHVASFDHVAATECALIHRRAREDGGHKRAPLSQTADWQKIKVDWQILAIAKVHKCRVITADTDIIKMAPTAGVQLTRIDDLQIPESARQRLLPQIEAKPPLQLVRKAGRGGAGRASLPTGGGE